MKKITQLFFLITSLTFAQTNNSEQQTEVFLPEFFKEFPHVRDISISNNQQEMYFTVLGYKKEFSFIAVSFFKKGKWLKPAVAPFSGLDKDLEPFLSPDNLKLFFASNRSLENEEKTDFDIWMVQRETLTSNWSNPINVGPEINTLKDEFYPAVTNSGNLYFTATIDEDTKGKEDIYLSTYENGKYTKPKSISDAINSKTYEFNAYVSPDESVIVFSSYNRPDGFGGGDLYMSTKDNNGQWMPAKNLGPEINSSKIDYCPFVDFSTNSLYFTSEKSTQKSQFEKFMELEDYLKYFNSAPNGLSRIYKTKFIQNHID
ncbi:TolB family protein [Urechidicola vernalis]|uniref:WD40 repeat protein n=1 Tax=Urechidicola vernalis TaxID=3075600 RepID=A0ABU2Y7P6_9FLAO|nr:hypothetical protein [Urechidicola sp. P050]MDT0554211.1 hypothetical protein [Urechidicola sp. P050]